MGTYPSPWLWVKIEEGRDARTYAMDVIMHMGIYHKTCCKVLSGSFELFKRNTVGWKHNSNTHKFTPMYMGEMLLKCITSVALRLRMQIHNLHSIPIYEIHGINQLDYWKNPLGDGQTDWIQKCTSRFNFRQIFKSTAIYNENSWEVIHDKCGIPPL